MSEPTAMAKEVTLKEFLLGIVNERDRKYDDRFVLLDKAVESTNESVKQALASANASVKQALDSANATLASANATTKDSLAASYAYTRDALASANSTIAAAAVSVDERFKSVNEFRGQLADQQETFARKSDVDAAMAAFEKATLKAEAATERRFEAANDFRSQLLEQQATFARKPEVDIRFDALDKKLDTAIQQLQIQRGHAGGMSSAGAIVGVALTILVSAAALLVALLKHP